MKFTAKFFAVLVCAGGAASAFAYEPPNNENTSNFRKSMSLCQSHLRSNKSPGEVSEADYALFRDEVTDALQADPQLKEWKTVSLGVNPGEMYPKCAKLYADFAAGVDAEKKPTLWTSCEHNTNARLDSVLKTYAADFDKNPDSAKAWFARKDLEAARWYMTQTDGWRTSGGCATNDKFKKAFEPLKVKFAEAEKIVQKIEAHKKIKFDRMETIVKKTGITNSVHYIDLRTNAPLAKSDTY